MVYGPLAEIVCGDSEDKIMFLDVGSIEIFSSVIVVLFLYLNVFPFLNLNVSHYNVLFSLLYLFFLLLFYTIRNKKKCQDFSRTFFCFYCIYISSTINSSFIATTE